MPDLVITKREDAVSFKVSVKPKARRNAVEGIRAGALLIHVTAAPERGEANRAVVEALSEWTGIPRSHIAIVAGHKSRQKIVQIACLSHKELQCRIASLVDGT